MRYASLKLSVLLGTKRSRGECLLTPEKSTKDLAEERIFHSMGFIYSLASSVLIVLKEPAWIVISRASTKLNPGALSYADMYILENDKWISRVWTYQELVNSAHTYFTTLIKDPNLPVPVVKAEPFFNCVGCSLQAWKMDTESAAAACLQVFPNLNMLESTLVDWKMAAYLDRSALGVLSSISMRSYDPNFPQNRLLACLGALTVEASWGPPSTTLAELVEKFMRICESKVDYSFIYTSDERSDVPGIHWRPAAEQEGGANLRPIVSWDISGSQTGHRDAQGRSWLDNMIRLYPSSGDQVSGEGVRFIKDFLYGISTPGRETIGFYNRDDERGDLLDAVLDCLAFIGFKGYPIPTICEHGLFFGQLDSYGKQAELYISGDMQWVFGRPGLCRWFVDEGEGGKEDAEWRYCAGVYAGLVPRNQRGSKLALA